MFRFFSDYCFAVSLFRLKKQNACFAVSLFRSKQPKQPKQRNNETKILHSGVNGRLQRDALKMADLRRLAPTCADLRLPALICADLRRPRIFFFCHRPKLSRVLDTQQRSRSQKNYFEFLFRPNWNDKGWLKMGLD